MPQYFDPRARVVAIPAPRAVSPVAASAPGAYFDPASSRPSRYASWEEIAAAVAALDPVAHAALAGLVAPGETVEMLAWRRCAFVPRCQWCRAPGGGVLGHTATCREVQEERLRSETARWRRRPRIAETGAAPDELYYDPDLPF